MFVSEKGLSLAYVEFEEKVAVQSCENVSDDSCSHLTSALVCPPWLQIAAVCVGMCLITSRSLKLLSGTKPINYSDQ